MAAELAWRWPTFAESPGRAWDLAAAAESGIDAGPATLRALKFRAAAAMAWATDGEASVPAGAVAQSSRRA